MTHRLLLHRKAHPGGAAGQTSDLELELTSLDVAAQTEYALEGTVHTGPAWDVLDGGSLLIHAPASYMAAEVFFDAQGNFQQDVDLIADQDNLLYLTVCDPVGRHLATTAFTVRHGTPAQSQNAVPPIDADQREDEPIELKPDWPVFARLVKDCLIHAGEIADQTGRNRDELFEQIYAQERYAEGAVQETNPRLYRECFINLMRFAEYLEQLYQEHLVQVRGGNQPPTRDDLVRAVQRLERELIFLESRLRPEQHAELRTRAQAMRQGLAALARRADRDLSGAAAELRELFKELEQLRSRLAALTCRVS